MTIDVAGANVVDLYHLLIGAVVPRPIAWVTTVDSEGRPNLAPFSFFNAFGANPPVVVFSPTRKRDGSKKDTLRNVEATGEFIVHAATASLAEKVNMTSRELPYGESEIDLAVLRTGQAVKVRPPLILDSPIRFECRVLQLVPVGNGPISANLVIGEVVYMHVEDEILDDHGRIDPRKLNAVARLGGEHWCRTTDLFEQKRP